MGRRGAAKKYETSPSQANFREPDQTLLIYDWDDTLFPSCWVQDMNLSFFKPPPNIDSVKVPLQKLEKLVAALLTTSLQLGEVVIVTNAQDPWVETSCRNFMPGLAPLLQKIPVRYAHSIYMALGLGSTEEVHPAIAAATKELEQQASEASNIAEVGAPGMFFPSKGSARRKSSDLSIGSGLKSGTASSDSGGESLPAGAKVAFTLTGMTFTVESTVDLESAPQHWKEAAFREELKRFYSRYDGQSWKNVISIGDATFERDALRIVVTGRPTKQRRCRTKTAKLLDCPSIEELMKQLKALHDGISLFVRYDGNLDVEINERDIDFGMEVIERMMQ